MKIKPKYYLVKSIFLSKTVSKGFTLLELIIVVIITSILSAVAVPAIMSQIGKAREAEAKMTLSSIGIAQQEYFFEKATFANQMSQLSVGVASNYYSYPDPDLVSPIAVKHEAIPFDALNRNIRHYSIGIYYNNDRSYSVILCQSDNPSTVAEVGNAPNAGCITGDLLY